MKKTFILCLTVLLLSACAAQRPADLESSPIPVLETLAPEAPPEEVAQPQETEESAGLSSNVEPTAEPVPEATAEPVPEPTPVPAPEPTPRPLRSEWGYDAVELVPSASISVGMAGADLSMLLDRNYDTTVSFFGTSMIRLDFETECSGLYLVWYTPPGEWKTWDKGETILCGQYEFLHEYVELPIPTSMVELILPNGGVLCDIYAVGDGRLPSFFQVWRPPEGKADLLAFPTHGDDELLFFGGTLPYYAGELGMEVQVAYMTNHSNEMPRPHEQLNGLWTVGVTRYPVLSANIDKMTNTLYDAEAIYGNSFKDFQVQMIRRFQPLVVVGHDVDGEYGHGSHRLAGQALLESVPLAADPTYDPASVEWFGVWNTPKLYLHMYWENPMEMNWDIPLSHFGGKTAFQVAQEGYQQHLSQLHWAFHVYPRDEYLSCYRFGLARSTVGPDVQKNDFFENIPPRDQINP